MKPAGLMIDPLLLTVEQTAEALNLSRTMTYELISSGAIESTKIGRSRRVPRQALDDYVAKLRTAGSAATA